MDKYLFNLQLFADGGGAAGGDGGAAAGAGEAGVQAPDAGVQKGRKRNPLADVQYGKQVAPAQAKAADNTQDVEKANAKPSFDELIKGEYKDAFGEKVHGIIQERFKANTETEARMSQAQPIFEMLAQKFDLDASDIEGIAKALGDDDSLYEQEAMDRGMTVESLKTIRQLERDNQRMKAAEEQSIAEQRMHAHFEQLAHQADEAKQFYPGLDLGAEMQNPTFARLTAPGVGVDVRTAYEVVHRDELRGAEMQFAAQKSAERMANAVISGSMRPSENGLNSQQSNQVVKTDPTSFTKADRAEIRRRVARGEKIIL